MMRKRDATNVSPRQSQFTTIHVRNSRAKFRFVKLFRFAANRPRWRGKNFESAKMRTKRHYRHRCTVQLGSSNGVGVHFFLLDEQSSKMKCRMFQPRPAAELIATRVITAFQKRLHRLRRCHADGEPGTKKGGLREMEIINALCKIARFPSEIKWNRGSALARYFRNYLLDKL